MPQATSSTRAELEVVLGEQLPPTLAAGRGNAIFIRGIAAADGRTLRRLRVDAGGTPQSMLATGMPGGGFWGIVTFEPPPRAVSIRMHADLESGGEESADIGTIELEAELGRPIFTPPVDPGGSGPLVAIAMATHEPDPALLERQIASLRAQTHARWVCVISDDASSAKSFAALERELAGDRRFALSRSEGRLGFYRNFERALAMVGDVPSYVALADQDDRWHPDKLETLVAAIGDATLAYSDARTTRPDGTTISQSLWDGRRNNRTNLASLLLSNTVTGAASLFQRRLLDLVLPFPSAPGTPYHDHWIALVALACGELAYVERPLLDYVQHPGAVLGSEAIRGRGAPGIATRARRLARDPSAALGRWRDGYFDEYCRTLVLATVLKLRCAPTLSVRKRRALDRLIAGDGSPLTLGWLAARPLRGLVGRNETRRFEHRLLRGIAWRHLSRSSRLEERLRA